MLKHHYDKRGCIKLNTNDLGNRNSSVHPLWLELPLINALKVSRAAQIN